MSSPGILSRYAGEGDAKRRARVPRYARNAVAARTDVHRAACVTLTLVASRLDLSRFAGEVFMVLALLFSTATFAAEEDKDLDLIPPAAQQSGPAAAPTAPVPATSDLGTQRNYVEDAISATPLRTDLAVPFPSPTPASWEDRLFLDFRDEWPLGGNVTLTYSGRLNLRVANDIPFASHESCSTSCARYS